jgi:spore germination cell wall hydrolase CwlJ-like protein
MTLPDPVLTLARTARTAGLASAAVCAMALLPLASEQARAERQAAAERAEAARFLEAQAGIDLFADPDSVIRVAALTIDTAVDALQPLVQSRSLDDLQTFDFSHLSSAREAAAERQCLAEAVYYEARGETVQGQLAVAEVVLNRVRHRAYPDTICGVVYQGAGGTRGCQFTFACDGSNERAPRGRAWERSELVAKHALMGFSAPLTSAATHYHTVAVNPHWSNAFVQTRQIGVHLFYRMPSAAERRDRGA